MFEGAQLKIERAKSHVRDLEAEINAFHNRNPYVVVAEDDPKTGDQNFRLRIREEVPACLSGIIGDIIHNLRAVFDLIATDVVVANGGRPNSAYFPVSYTPKTFKSDGLKKIGGASQKAIDIVERLQPYHAGNEAILQLHKLDILDKHQAIIPVGAASTGVDPGIVMNVPWHDEPIESPPFFINPADRQYPLKDGTIIFTIRAKARDAAAKNKPKFKFDVAFGEGQIVDGEPVIPKITQFVQFTEQTLDAFRREFCR